MARQRPHIIAIGQGALRHQHAVGAGSGFGRPQLGGRNLGRGQEMADAVDFGAGREAGTNPCVI